jgi:hypothetical protein
MVLQSSWLATSRASEGPDDQAIHWSEVGGQGQCNQLGEAQAPTTT